MINTPCPNCNLYKKTKPGVIFFHEQAPLYPQLLTQFSKADTYLNGKYTPIIKIVIGTSLKVITDVHLQPNRGLSILIDINPCNADKFSLIVAKSATKGIVDINNFISKNYKF